MKQLTFSAPYQRIVFSSSSAHRKLPLPGTSLVHQLFASVQADGFDEAGTQALVKALARVPADRFPSAFAFLEALTTPDAARASRRSIAVLPFANLSSDPENEYFADGITEDVIAQLSKIGALKVISRTSVIQFKKREQSLREIGERLGRLSQQVTRRTT